MGEGIAYLMSNGGGEGTELSANAWILWGHTTKEDTTLAQI